jgi:hypothetical protein
MTANAYPFGSLLGHGRPPRIGLRCVRVPSEPHRARATRVIRTVAFAAAIGCNGAVAQAPRAASGQDQQSSAVTEIACPRGTQILILLQSSSAPAYVAVDEMPAAGHGDARRLDDKTVAPDDMPDTLELTQVVGDREVFVTVRDRAPNVPPDPQSHLEGYIGCGGWQARVLGGQVNTYLLKRTPSTQPAAKANAAPAPNFAPAEANAAPPSVPNAPSASPSRRNDRQATRGGAQDAPRIASELKTLGLLGIWAHSCDGISSIRDIFVDRSGRSFWRPDGPDSPPDRFKREIVDFQRLSANRFQVTSRGRFAGEENATVTARYRMENHQLFAEDIRSASGHVTVESGRTASGRLQGQATRGLFKCRW